MTSLPLHKTITSSDSNDPNGGVLMEIFKKIDSLAVVQHEIQVDLAVIKEKVLDHNDIENLIDKKLDTCRKLQEVVHLKEDRHEISKIPSRADMSPKMKTALITAMIPLIGSIGAYINHLID